MRKICSIMLLLSMNAFAQGPVVESLDSKEDASGFWIASDADGNTYVTGSYFGPTITFGGTTLVNPTPPNQVMFIVKYNAAGAVSWAKSAGSGANFSAGISIAADHVGNSYVTGHFSGPTINFGSTTLTNTSATTSDMFIVKYDASGTVAWAKSAGSNNSDIGQDIAVDTNGNCYVTGQFTGSSITLGSSTLINPSSGSNAIFIVKYDGAGNAMWAKTGGSGSGYGIGADAMGNSYVTGFYNGASISFDTVTASGGGADDMFVVKHDSNGNALWLRSPMGTSYDAGYSLTADSDGNSYVTGTFNSPTLIFGSYTLINISNTDVLTVKYDTDGNVSWATSVGGSGYEYGADISLDKGGNCFIVGGFTSTSLLFASTTLSNDTTDGTQDVFVAKYDANGNAMWATDAGGTASDYGFGITVDRIGNSYITGYFQSDIFTLAPYAVNMTPGPNPNDLFITKLKDNCFAHYTTSYDSILNDFSIYIDSTSSAMAVAYHWDFGDGTTSTLATPSHVYTLDTLYELCMKIYTAVGDSCEYCHTIGIDSLGNIVRTTPGFTINVYNVTTSTQQLLEEIKITVAPNPFTTSTLINFSEEQKASSVKIIDMLGKEVKAMMFTGKQLIIEKAEMKEGIYFLQVVDQNKKVVNKKLVVQ